MKKTIQYIGMALLCLFFSSPALAQTEALKIGDKVPDVTINNIINYKTTTVKLSDFKGKLLILDFWATWCAACIPSLIKLDSLQQQFKGELLVMPVTRQAAAIAAPFLAKKSIGLPSVTSDVILKSYFPHTSVPHQVWILNGEVKAITTHYSATAENITAMLGRNGRNDMVMKLDQVEFKPAGPLLAAGNGGAGKELLYQSVITAFIEGAGYHNVMTTGQIMITNNSVAHLYRKAFEKEYPWTRLVNRTFIDLDDDIRDRLTPPEALKGEDQLRWYKTRGYCYNLYAKDGGGAKSLALMMQDDLNRFFGIRENMRGSIETKLVKCLVLSVQDEKLLRHLKAEGSSAADDMGIVSRNLPFPRFSEMLAAVCDFQPLPLIDETAYQGPAYIALDLPRKDLPALKIALQRYGLKLTEQEREIPMLVLSPAVSGHTNSPNLKTNSHE